MILKSRFVFILLCLFYYSGFAQKQDWVWADGAGTGLRSNGCGNAITVTTNNLIYCTGQFNSTVISFGHFVLANEDNYYENDDIFIVCYNSSGEVVWAKSFGGNGDDSGKSIACDSDGNIYITGGFTSDKIGFGKDALYNAGQAGTNDAFVAKYNGRGEEMWVKRIGESHDDKGNGIATDKDGNVYVTGSFFSGNIIFEKGDTLKNKDPSGSSPDIFIVKYSKDGKFVWAKVINGSKYEYGCGIVTDSKNNVYVTGDTFSSEIYLDSITITTSTVEKEDERRMQTEKPTYMMVDDKRELHDTAGISSRKVKGNEIVTVLPKKGKTFEKIFIAKYSESGKLEWAESVGVSDDEEGSAIATDGNDNVFLTGRFQSTSMTMETTTMENNGSNDIFIAKYNSNGKTIWAKSVGGIADDRGNTIATDGLGNIYIAGWFASKTALFRKCTQLNSGGKNYTDIFIAKYYTFGNGLWAENAKGRDSEWCNGTVTDGQGNIYLTGGFDSPEMSFGNTKLVNEKKKSFFISKTNRK